MNTSSSGETQEHTLNNWCCKWPTWMMYVRMMACPACLSSTCVRLFCRSVLAVQLPLMTRSHHLSVSRPVSHNFLKGREYSLPCSYRRTCWKWNFPMTPHVRLLDFRLVGLSVIISSFTSHAPIGALVSIFFSPPFHYFQGVRYEANKG